MSSDRKKITSVRRQRRKQAGTTRPEPREGRQDRLPVRRVVAASADPKRGAEAGQRLGERSAGRKAAGLKALLAVAPLEGIDLTRPSDLGRDDGT